MYSGTVFLDMVYNKTEVVGEAVKHTISLDEFVFR